MLTEDYCNFDIAKLLKEKGFDGECMSMYVTPKPYAGMGNPNEAKIAPHGRDSHYYDGYLYQCEAPTLQMAMKWLREAHNIIIELHHRYRKEWYAIVSSENPLGIGVYTTNTFNTYEEACEAGIKYCLENLI